MCDSQIPKDWIHAPLGELGKITTGSTPPTSMPQNYGGDIPFVGPADLGDFRSITSSSKSVTEHGARQSRTLEAKAVLVSCIGILGKTGQADQRLTFNQQINAIAPYPSKVDPTFLYYLSNTLGTTLEKLAGLQVIPIVNKREFSNITRPVPRSLHEQKKIARVLDTLDTQIQKTETLIAKLEKIKEGLLHDLLTRGIDQNGQLRPTPEQAPELYKDSALGLIPKRWEVRSIVESGVKLIDGDRGANYPSDQDFNSGSGYCIFLSAKNVTRSGFRFDTRQFISKDKDRVLGTGKLVRNDVVVTTRGTVGNFAHYNHSIPYDNIRINSGMLILRGAESNLIPEFLYLSLKEHLFHRENGRKGSGSAQPQLPARDFESFLLVIPGQTEQQKIIEFASAQDQRIKAENDEIRKLTSLKDGLMDDLLTGRVRVTPLLNGADVV